MKPSFSVPFVKTPGIVPYINGEILSEFSYQSINSKPEAPWIKRIGTSIKFTDEIKKTTDEFSLNSSEINSKEKDFENDEVEISKIEEENKKQVKKSKSTSAVSPLNI